MIGKIIKQGLFFMSAGLIACTVGCSSVSDTNYYILSSSMNKQDYICQNNCKYVLLQAIDLPEYLKKVGIAFRVSENRIINADQNRWAEGLGEQLTRSFKNHVNATRKDLFFVDRVSVSNPNVQLSLNITIDSFNGSYDGYAYVLGSWVVSNTTTNEVVSSGIINQKQELTDDGYDALVSALDKAWTDAIPTISNSL